MSLQLASLSELLDEIERRCVAYVVALRYCEEGDVEVGEFTTTTRLGGDFIEVSGLTAYLETRAERYRQEKLEQALRAVTDEGEPWP